MSISVTVDGFTIKETLFGRAIVNYSCPDCDSLLQSPISDIGKNDNCPNCQCLFSVPGKNALKAYKNLKKERETRQAINKQKVKEEEQIAAEKEAEIKSMRRSLSSNFGCLHEILIIFVISVFIAPYGDDYFGPMPPERSVGAHYISQFILIFILVFIAYCFLRVLFSARPNKEMTDELMRQNERNMRNLIINDIINRRNSD